MTKRTPRKGKIRTEIWVAVIGLAGVVITAIFSSPVLITLIERTAPPPTPTAAGISSPSPAAAPPGSPLATSPAAPTTPVPVPSANCQPAGIAELPPQAVAVVVSTDGAQAQIPLGSLRYESQTSLRLASGLKIEFNKMQRADLINPDFSQTFTAEITITLLDCTIHKDILNPSSDSNLTGESALGAFQLYALRIKSIVFEW